MTDEEAQAVATAIQAALYAGDSAAYGEQFDWNAFQQFASAESDDGRDKYRRSMAAAVSGASATLVSNISQQLATGGSYQFLRVRNHPDHPDAKRALFRMLLPDGGLNYHEYWIVRGSRGVRAVDIYVYIAGERLSESILRMLVAVLPSAPAGRPSRAAAQAALQDSMQMKELSETARTNPHRALAIFDELPRTVRQAKPVMLLRMVAAQRVDETAYATAIQEYQAAFPNDPSLHLVSLDGFLMRRDFESAHDAIDVIDEALGGDPYLEILHGSLLVMEGELDLAERIAVRRIAKDPRQLEPHWLLISVQLKRREFPAVATALAMLRDDLGVQLHDLTQIPDYAEFVKSPEYADLMKGAAK